MPAAAVQADRIFRQEFQARAGGRFALAPAGALDEGFLRQLFAETLLESVQRSGAEPSALTDGPLLELQFRARAQAYSWAYPGAQDYMVAREPDQVLIGRLLIDWTPAGEFVGVDVAVRRAERAGAAGRHLLRAWLATCDRLGRAARLHVMPENPARLIYQRLGFLELDRDVFPLPMRREPRARGAARPPAI
jgi:GNAT superfamily N-acetyltransferase